MKSLPIAWAASICCCTCSPLFTVSSFSTLRSLWATVTQRGLGNTGKEFLKTRGKKVEGMERRRADCWPISIFSDAPLAICSASLRILMVSLAYFCFSYTSKFTIVELLSCSSSASCTERLWSFSPEFVLLLFSISASFKRLFATLLILVCVWPLACSDVTLPLILIVLLLFARLFLLSVVTATLLISVCVWTPLVCPFCTLLLILLEVLMLAGLLVIAALFKVLLLDDTYCCIVLLVPVLGCILLRRALLHRLPQE